MMLRKKRVILFLANLLLENKNGLVAHAPVRLKAGGLRDDPENNKLPIALLSISGIKGTGIERYQASTNKSKASTDQWFCRAIQSDDA